MNTIISIILIVVSIATFYLYINPTYVGKDGKGGIKQLMEQKKQLSFRTQKVVDLQKKGKELIKKYSTIEAANQHALDNLLKMIPNNVENARLINYINYIKVKDLAGSQLSDIRISDGGNTNKKNNGKIIVKKEKDYSSINLAFSFQSNYENFVKFMDDLYKSLRLVDVVSITASQEKGSHGQAATDLLKFNIVIRTY